MDGRVLGSDEFVNNVLKDAVARMVRQNALKKVRRRSQRVIADNL